MKSLYDRINFKKQLVDKSKDYLDFNILEEQYKRFVSGLFKGSISEEDSIRFLASKAYAELNRLLHEHDGKIVVPGNIVVGENISNMVDEMKKDPNQYLTYFYSLLAMGNEALTIRELSDRIARIYSLPEFTEETSPEVKRQKVIALSAASGTLSEIIEENNGVIKNTDRLRDIASKTYYAKKASLDELSDEDKDLYERIAAAKARGIKKFLPPLLIKPQNGVISVDSVQDEYNRIARLGVFGPNMSFKEKIEFEKIYAAIQYTLLENGGAIEFENRDSIMENFPQNISKVEEQAKISAILSSRDSFTEELLAGLFNESIERDNINPIKAAESKIDFEIAYCAIVNEIKRRGGICSSQEAKAAYKRALDLIEKHKLEYRSKTKSPFLVFPKDETGREDDIYLNLLSETSINMEENATTENVGWLCESVGRIKAIRELYDIIKNPIKRRELDAVKYDVVVSEGIKGLEVCDLQFIRNASPEYTISLENSVGDEIEVMETGKLGYATMRQKSGQPTFSDNVTVKQYEVKKTYLSEQEKGKAPLVRKFTVFSPRIDSELILGNDVLKSIFADQIFSDMSLEAAEEKNGSAIATAEVIKTEEGMKPQIYFDENMVGACRKMSQMVNEYSEAEDKKGVKRLFAKKIQNGALVGNYNIQLSNGFASKIMSHINGDISQNDILVGFEWSDIEKKRTIFDLVARSRMQDRR